MEKFYVKDNIIIEKGLSDKNFNDIMDLLTICEEHDKANLDQDKLVAPPKDETNDFLFYREDRLIGYLGIYPSANDGEMKINGIIHPSFRRRGIFSGLFQEAKKICIEKNLNTIIIINEQSSKNGKAFAISTGAKLKYTTYKMDLVKKCYQEEAYDSNVFMLRVACDEDINDIVNIGMQGFGTSEKEEIAYNEFNLKNPNRSVYIAKYNNTTVGIITVVIQNKEAYLCDLAVHQNYRRKGLGREILLRSIDNLLRQGIVKVRLSVEVRNRNALSLYEECGFRVIGALDFYELHL